MSHATASSPSPRTALAGLLLLAGLALQILRLAGLDLALHWVSYACWLAVLLLWRDIPRRTRWQAGSLAAIGLGLLLAARLRYGAEVRWTGALNGNVYVVAMLLGVSFIGLIGNRRGDPRPLGQAVTGVRGSLGTWLGTHLLGAILNLSTMFMIGDRLARRGPLTAPQLLAINRGLSSAAFWSPFFASMGVVMTLSPEMRFTTVLAFGMPLAFAAGALTVLELSRRFDLTGVAGYSLSPRSLRLPALLAALVMLCHYVVTPSLSIVSIITFLLPLAAVASNLPQGLRWTQGRLRQHVRERLPAMRGEVSLFLCAGLLTLGLSTFVAAATGGDWRLFDHFGAREAVMSFLAIVASAVAGLHPIIGVSVLASVLELSGERQTLFACVALASWAVGTSVGPLSGINLSMQGRYGVSGTRMMCDNLGYAAAMTVLVVVALVLLDAWLS